MTMSRTIEMLSIDITNRCSKQCTFCYNHSTAAGVTQWDAGEVIDFARDCVSHGVKAISLGGGEPLEHPGIFDIIKALQPIAYLSITSNGLPLLDDEVKARLAAMKPDKMHLSLHNPHDRDELQRVCRQVDWLASTGIKPGVNLLVSTRNLDAAASAYRRLRRHLTPDQIILLPMRYSLTPTPGQLAAVAGGEKFQCASCLLQCERPQTFASVTWDKKANSCSYAGGKQPLPSLTYQGLQEALNQVNFAPCTSPVNQPQSTLQ